MPLYNFQCDACKRTVRRIFDVQDVDSFEGSICFDNGACQGKWRRVPTGPTSQVMEKLDNGISPRTVERWSDAERVWKERSDNDPRDKED